MLFKMFTKVYTDALPPPLYFLLIKTFLKMGFSVFAEIHSPVN